MRSDRADIGFIGAGQLARMSAAAAIALEALVGELDLFLEEDDEAFLLKG